MKGSESPRRATIRDVAAQAGVSRAAVSKVLRNAYGVSPSMKARVEEAMSILNYRPLTLARGLRGHSYTVGVILLALDNPFFSVLVDGICDIVEPQGLQVLVGRARRGFSAQADLMEAMLDRRMDGLILIAPFGPAEVLEILGGRAPTVVIGRHGPSQNYDTVAGDDLAGAEQVINELVSLGHREITFLAHTARDENHLGTPQEVRRKGYVDAMVRHGLRNEIDIIESRWTLDGGQAAVHRILGRGTMPTALFAGSDMSALGAIAAFVEAGLDIPGSVSVVGYDNIDLAALPSVSLTTIDQSGYEMGATAAKFLLQRMAGRQEPRSFTAATRLVARSTCSGPRG